MAPHICRSGLRFRPQPCRQRWGVPAASWRCLGGENLRLCSAEAARQGRGEEETSAADNDTSANTANTADSN